MEAVKQAARKISSSGLFSYVKAIQHSDEKDEGGSIYETKPKESSEIPFKHSAFATCKISSNLTFKDTRSLKGSVTTSNFFDPKDNLSAKLEYVHKVEDSVYNPKNLIYKTSFFSSRKPSPVFTAGPGCEEVVPSISVNRVGLQTNVSKNFIGQSKLRLGFGLEEIKTRDENRNLSANGLRVLSNGDISVDGPPTTLSGTGVDHMFVHHAEITRDNTRLLNGATVGEKTVLQMNQGLALGNNFPAYTRYQLTLTRSIQLKQVEEGAGNPEPPVLVLHGHYGVSVGDLPSYEAFALGGPYSVRGYKTGELGAARSILELGAELRVPVKSALFFAFAEHGNDLGSSKDVKGNPTAVYGKTGRGSSYGVGVRVGRVRAQYAVNHSGTGSLFVRFGR